MKDNCKKLSRKMARMISMILILFSIVSCIVLWANKDNVEYKIDYLNDGWDIKYGDIVEQNVDIFNWIEENDLNDADEDNEIVISRQLDIDKDIIYPSIVIDSPDCFIDVYYKDKLLGYNYNKKNKGIKNNFYIRIPKDYEDETIDIHIKSKNMETYTIKNIYVISESNYFFHMLRSNLIKYMSGTLMIILGVIVTSAILFMRNKSDKMKKLLWTGVAFMEAGVSMYAEYDILSLFVKINDYIANIKAVSIYMCVFSIMMMTYYELEKKKSRMNFAAVLMGTSIGYIFICMLYNIQILSYNAVMNYFKICVAVLGGLLFIIHSYKNKESQLNKKIYYTGMNICIVECGIVLIISILFKNTVITDNIEYYIIILAMTFFTIILIYYANMVDNSIEKITEKNILTQLAYTDYLTGLYNRTKYEETLKELDYKDNLTVISCDLNNLKKVNDRLGHDIGDRYIKEFSMVINKIFNNYGDVYRVGGDEFIILTYGKLKDVKEMLKDMTTLFEKENKKEEFGVNVSFAYGYSNGNEDNVRSVEKLVKIADERMYKFKEKQKKNIK